VPILDVEVVGPLAPAASRRLAPRLAEGAGEVLGAPVGNTWVRVRRLASSAYAESGGGPPRGVRPVFVALLLRRPPRGRALARLVDRLTDAVAAACRRPRENVHVIVRAPAGGRAAFGGGLLPR
jgi:phenylpyruvate tautomerase PptA (4-oxalocrotonate tautomerase family)